MPTTFDAAHALRGLPAGTADCLAWSAGGVHRVLRTDQRLRAAHALRRFQTRRPGHACGHGAEHRRSRHAHDRARGDHRRAAHHPHPDQHGHRRAVVSGRAETDATVPGPVRRHRHHRHHRDGSRRACRDRGLPSHPQSRRARTGMARAAVHGIAAVPARGVDTRRTNVGRRRVMRDPRLGGQRRGRLHSPVLSPAHRRDQSAGTPNVARMAALHSRHRHTGTQTRHQPDAQRRDCPRVCHDRNRHRLHRPKAERYQMINLCEICREAIVSSRGGCFPSVGIT